MCDPARRCGTRSWIFVGSQVFGRTVPINLSHASTHTPVSAQPVESHPVFFLRPYRDVSLPHTHPPSQEAPKSQQAVKPTRRLFHTGCKGYTRASLCQAVNANVGGEELAAARNFSKLPAWEVKWAPGGGEMRTDVEEQGESLLYSLINARGHGWPWLRGEMCFSSHTLGLWEKCGWSSSADTKNHHQDIWASIWNKLRGSVSADKLHLRGGIPWSYSQL